MLINYIRRKKLSRIEEKKYYDCNKFKEYYGFDLRDVNPTEKSFEYHKNGIETAIKDLCKFQNTKNVLFDGSLVFNRFKLHAEELEEVAKDLPFQLFFPIFERYFPEIKSYFLKEFIDNGINHTYEEVKNHIVNHSDMKFIIDPMNVAIRKTIDYVNNRFESNKVEEIYKCISKISSKTWFGDERDGEYELSLDDFFVTYINCIEKFHSHDLNFWSLMKDGFISSLIMYLWYVTCNYYYNSKDEKISYIRTDVEMFYMRNLHNNNVNYTYFEDLIGKKKDMDNDLNGLFNYYSSFTDFAKIYLGKDVDKYFKLVKTVSEWKSKYKSIVDVPSEESLSLFVEIDKLLLFIEDQVKIRKNNSLLFDPLERLIECIIDPMYNSIVDCRPKLYLDLATPKMKYYTKKESNDGK